MKKLILILVLLLAIPSSYASLEDQAKDAADNFVREYGIFHHKTLLIDDIRLFRTTYYETKEDISFLYLVTSSLGVKEIKARFVVAVQKEGLKIADVYQLREPADTPKIF